MDYDLYYDSFTTPAGIKIEAISGGEGLSDKVAAALARQVWQERGPAGYRVIEHFPNGAPAHSEIPTRISVSHTKGLFVVASLPRTPEADLAVFNLRTAMGVDCEPLDREQVNNIRERFLTASELSFIPDETLSTLLAWTAKEAAYKAALTDNISFSEDIQILSLPNPEDEQLGQVAVNRNGEEIVFSLFSLIYEGFVITVAFSPKCAAFKKKLSTQKPSNT